MWVATEPESRRVMTEVDAYLPYINIECRLDGGSATIKENCGVVLYLSRRK